MPKHLTFLIALTILLIPTYLVRFSPFSIPTNLFEIITLITIFFLFFYKKRVSLLTLLKNNSGTGISILFIFIGLCASTIAAGSPSSSLGIIKSWFLIPVIFFFLLISLPQKRFVGKLILQSFFVSIFLVSIIALIYAILGNLTYDGRLSAFYLSPNHLAMYLAPGIFIGSYLAQSALKNKNFKKFLLIATAVVYIMIALYLTKSYSAWISVAAAYPILLFSSKSGLFRYFGRIFIFILIFVLIISSQISTEKFFAATHISERSSMASRIMIWQSAIKIASENPLWGIGPGKFQETYLAYQKYFPPYLEWAVPQPHNLYLAFWLQAGIVGFLGFILLIIISFHKVRCNQNNKKTAPIAVLFAVYLMSVLIWGIVDTPYWKNDLAFTFWVLMTLCYQNPSVTYLHEKKGRS